MRQVPLSPHLATDRYLPIPKSAVDPNVYVIIESCSTFGNTSTPLDEAPSRSGCAHSTVMPRRKQRRRLSGLRVVTCPTSKRLVTVFSNTRLILAPATASTSDGDRLIILLAGGTKKRQQVDIRQ